MVGKESSKSSRIPLSKRSPSKRRDPVPQQCKNSPPRKPRLGTPKSKETEPRVKCDAEVITLGSEKITKDDTKDQDNKKPDEFFNKDLFGDVESTIRHSPKTEEGSDRGKKSGQYLLKYLDAPVSPEEDLATKRHLKHLFFHLTELALITTIAMSMVTSDMYYLSHITESLFLDTEFGLKGGENASASFHKNLRHPLSIEDFWDYAETTLLDLLYWEFFDSTIDPITHKSGSDKILYENQLLGVARLRQLRVHNNSCQIHKNMIRFFDSCYSFYSVFSEDTSDIRSDMENTSTETAWKYTAASKLKKSFYWGEVAIYGGGGYYLDLATTKENSKMMMKELKDNGWISLATRAVFIDFNIYNANANLFCICLLVLEFLPVGGIIPTAEFDSLKIIRYLTAFDFFILACEFSYALLTFYHTLEEIMKIKQERLCYLFSFWNYVNFMILLFSYVDMAIGIARYIVSNQTIKEVHDNYKKYVEFSTLRYLQIYHDTFIAIILFLIWLRLFSFINFTKTMVQFRQTLAKSLKEMFVFLPMFLIMLLSFALVAYLLFGTRVKVYSTVWRSFLTLLQAFLGEFNYTEILETHRVLGPIFYICFIFFIFFMFLNVFIAIINDAYAAVMAVSIIDTPKTCNYIRRGFGNFFHCFRPRRKKKLCSLSIRKRLLFDGIENALKRAGFKKEEILIFFEKYKINYQNFLDEKVRTRLMKDLNLKQNYNTETSEQCQINLLKRRLNDFQDMFESLEMRLQPVIDKVDILYHRL